MARINKIIITLFLMAFMPIAVQAKSDAEDNSVRKERNYIRSGNKLYKDKRYADAEVEYKKALQINPNSDAATYNLATSLIRQGGSSDANDKNSPLNQATDMLTKLAKKTHNANIASKAYYNLGNIAYNKQDYSTSVECYKNALRKNPNDDEARDNLRLAQLKLKENKNNKNDDKNKDNNDKDKNKDNKDDKNQNQNNNQQQQPQPQQGMSKDNVEQILQTMQNKEQDTQQKVNAQKRAGVRKTGNQW